jgi:hypothetical protein
MAKKDTYSVHSKGKKVLDDFRGDRITGDVFAVIKYDAMGGEAGAYNVITSTIGDRCDCPAGQKQTCRHREMVYIFKEQGELDSQTARYSYDTQAWVNL